MSPASMPPELKLLTIALRIHLFFLCKVKDVIGTNANLFNYNFYV